MARKTVVMLVDDVDGSEADQTVTFSLNGVHYEIDLNQAHVNDLSAALQPFIDAGRMVGRGRVAQKPSTSNLAKVRAWARENGFEISDRGRVHKEAMAAYKQRS